MSKKIKKNGLNLNKKMIFFWLIITFSIGSSSFGYAYTSMYISFNELGNNPFVIIGFLNAMAMYSFALFFYTTLDLLKKKTKFEKKGKELGLQVIKCKECNEYFYALDFETTKLCSNCIVIRMMEKKRGD